MFKAGDTVECVDASGAAEGELRVGSHYKVASTTSSGVYTTLTDDPDAEWLTRRFEKVVEKQEEIKQMELPNKFNVVHHADPDIIYTVELSEGRSAFLSWISSDGTPKTDSSYKWHTVESFIQRGIWIIVGDKQKLEAITEVELEEIEPTLLEKLIDFSAGATINIQAGKFEVYHRRLDLYKSVQKTSTLEKLLPLLNQLDALLESDGQE